MDANMRIIMANLNRLIPLIKADFICDLIEFHDVLTQEDWVIINAKKDHDKTESLLIAVGRRGDEAMYALKHVLFQTENYQAIEILNSSDEDEDPTLAIKDLTIDDCCGSVEARSSLCFPDRLKTETLRKDLTDNSPVTKGKIVCSPRGTISIKPEHQFRVKLASVLREGKDIYRMRSQPRGYCIIINNIDFELLPKRVAADEDGEFISSIFDQLGFDVNHYENLSASDIEAVFEKYSQMDSLRTHDALVCVIMSHGVKCDRIVGADNHLVRTDTLLSYFNNYNCPALMNKPKLFFIQACRGDEFDYGLLDETTVADAGPVPGPVLYTREENNSMRIPTWGDICIVHSTISGYVALRSVSDGSWFTDALGWALIDHAHDKSLHEILMVVSSNLSSREGRAGQDSIKQAIEVIWRGWNKSLYFNPGINSD